MPTIITMAQKSSWIILLKCFYRYELRIWNKHPEVSCDFFNFVQSKIIQSWRLFFGWLSGWKSDKSDVVKRSECAVAACGASLMQCRFKSELDFDLWPARSIKYIVYTYTYIRNWCYEINHIIALPKYGWKLFRSYTKDADYIIGYESVFGKKWNRVDFVCQIWNGASWVWSVGW